MTMSPGLSVANRNYRRLLDTINALLGRTLERRTVIACVRGYFREREARQQAKNGGHAR